MAISGSIVAGSKPLAIDFGGLQGTMFSLMIWCPV